MLSKSIQIQKTKIPAKPIKRSEYAQLLFNVGAGWNDEKKIKEMLHSYHWMIQTITLKRSEISDSINQNMGTQHSAEATLPKATYSTSDPLFVEVFSREESYASIKKLEYEVTNIKEMSKFITDYRRKVILNKILDGRSIRAISLVGIQRYHCLM